MKGIRMKVCITKPEKKVTLDMNKDIKDIVVGSYIVDWGDGTIEVNKPTHHYKESGEYEVVLLGDPISFEEYTRARVELLQQLTKKIGTQPYTRIFSNYIISIDGHTI